MFISPISINSSPAFKASHSLITKKMVKNVKRTATKPTVVVPAALAAGVTLESLESLLKENGIYYCEPENNYIKIISGQNEGFYKIDVRSDDIKLTPLMAKTMVINAIDSSNSLGGFVNYKKMISDLKRQDIVRKGLQIHTYELNAFVPKKEQELAASNFSKCLKKKILPKDLFYIDTQAFYYNDYSRTAYRVNLYDANSKNKNGAFVSKCDFEVDKKGSAIGYTAINWNLYHRMPAKEIYKEQSQPSEELPLIVDSKNNKLFAESFRFGNTKSSYKTGKGIPNVLSHLENRVKIKNPNKNDLQFIKFYDKDNNIIHRIGYYDSSTGRSLIYNEYGKYMYQMEYNKNDFGEIVACSRL